jgi:signal transduction histidine kinase
MKPRVKKPYSIRRRIMIQFCLFSVLLSVLFSAYNFLFLYVIEDEFIVRDIIAEADYLQQEYDKNGRWPLSKKSNMVLHRQIDTLPNEVKKVLLEEPQRKEFFGEQGRHYHLHQIDTEPTRYLLAEVSQKLLVRPLRNSVLISLSILALLLTLLACFIGWRLARQTTKPLSDLAQLVDGVSPDKLPVGFARHYPNNEIGILASTLEKSMQHIQAFVEREQHFTRDASHELRTPIGVIKNAAELLGSDSNLSQTSRDLLQRINRASLQMEQTVNTLLSLAREESKHRVIAPVRLLPIVEKVIIQHAWLLEHKPVEVNIDIAEDAELMTQGGILQILLANLLSNAFQYTMQGQVSITFSEQQLRVFDTGPGIEEQIKDSLLEPLVKGSQSQGFGIGLSLVKRLCEHHRLELSIQSQTRGMMVCIGF